MADAFFDQRVSLESPYVRGRALFPADGEIEPTRAIWVTGNGVLTCVLADDTEPVQITFGHACEGLRPLRVKRVISFTCGGFDQFSAGVPPVVGLW